MAILPDLPGLKVEVVVDGEPLREYDDDTDAADAPKRTISRYVEATSGTGFEVRYSLTTDYPHMDSGILITIELDGRLVGNSLVPGNQLKAIGGLVDSFKGAEFYSDGTWHIRKFRFAELRIESESNRKLDETTLKALHPSGNITVRLHRVELYEKIIVPYDLPAEALEFGDIPEKALKGQSLSHHVSLGEPQVIGAIPTYEVRFLVGPDKAPRATFSFKYRSLAALKSLGIIPRTPSPSPSPVPPMREPRQLPTPEEAIEFWLRHNGEQVVPNLKREYADVDPSNDDDADSGEVVVVQEQVVKRQRVMPMEKDEVVDLT